MRIHDRLDTPGFRQVPRTGVIYVMTQAAQTGYRPDDPAWANLGQGAPEVTPFDGAPARIHSIQLPDPTAEYAPVAGLDALRDRVAALYNARYRQGMASQYTRDNVAISPGGRAALTRLMATMSRANVGHFLPDYTAYEELLGAFGTFVPIPIGLSPERQYAFRAADLRDEILGRGLSAVLLSNPCNPTGRVVHGQALQDWCDVARELRATLIFDEFYAHYAYVGDELTISAAAHVEDVDKDPVVIVDGLTKNWRYPGWRVCWTIGPKDLIRTLSSAGSFLDGGCAHPMQHAALPLLDRELADAEARAIQREFRAKRQLMLERLERMGVVVDLPPQGSFYCWGDLRRLPEGMRTGMEFFRAALDAKVIVVPGQFFDINPVQRRPERRGRLEQYARFSFGPDIETLRRGLDRLEAMIHAKRLRQEP